LVTFRINRGGLNLFTGRELLSNPGKKPPLPGFQPKVFPGNSRNWPVLWDPSRFPLGAFWEPRGGKTGQQGFTSVPTGCHPRGSSNGQGATTTRLFRGKTGSPGTPRFWENPGFPPTRFRGKTHEAFLLCSSFFQATLFETGVPKTTAAREETQSFPFTFFPPFSWFHHLFTPGKKGFPQKVPPLTTKGKQGPL